VGLSNGYGNLRQEQLIHSFNKYLLSAYHGEGNLMAFELNLEGQAGFPKGVVCERESEVETHREPGCVELMACWDMEV
jgi:hypothetical protein